MNESNIKRQIVPSATGVDLSLAAVVSKAVKPKVDLKGKTNHDGSRDFPAFINGYVDILKSRARRNKDNEIARSLLPDTDAALNILISSILSPSEMMESRIIVNNSSININTDLKSAMNTVVDEYLKNNYKLNDKTSLMLGDILATSGSYVVAVLPESSIDHMINKVAVGTESISSAINHIYKTKKIENVDVRYINSKGILSNSSNSPSSGLSLGLNNFLVDTPTRDYTPFITYSAQMFTDAATKAGLAQEANMAQYTEKNFTIQSDTSIAIIDNPDALKMSKVVNLGARQRQSKLAEDASGRYKGLGVF